MWLLHSVWAIQLLHSVGAMWLLHSVGAMWLLHSVLAMWLLYMFGGVEVSVLAVFEGMELVFTRMACGL